MRKACGVNSRTQMAFALDFRCELVLFIHSNLYKLHIYRINLFFSRTHNVNANKLSVKAIRIKKMFEIVYTSTVRNIQKKNSNIFIKVTGQTEIVFYGSNKTAKMPNFK